MFVKFVSVVNIELKRWIYVRVYEKFSLIPHYFPSIVNSKITMEKKILFYFIKLATNIFKDVIFLYPNTLYEISIILLYYYTQYNYLFFNKSFFNQYIPHILLHLKNIFRKLKPIYLIHISLKYLNDPYRKKFNFTPFQTARIPNSNFWRIL